MASLPIPFPELPTGRVFKGGLGPTVADVG
jgi:hypothetical protein